MKPIGIASLHIFKENSLKLSPKNESPWGPVKEDTSKVHSANANWPPIMKTAWCQVLESTVQTKPKYPLSSRAASDRVKVILVLGTRQRPPRGLCRFWHPKGHSSDHLGNWDRSRGRTSLNWVNSSRRNSLQVTHTLLINTKLCKNTQR